jgi:heat shock protein HslJ
MKLIHFALSVLLLSGCQSSQKETTHPTAEEMKTIQSDLQSKWMLELMNGTAVSPEDYPMGLPFLELKPADSTASGFTGCNRYIGSSITPSPGQLSFGSFGTTKMYCDNIDEASFLDNLTKTNRYIRKDNKLTLLSDETELMVFKKAD